MPITPRKDSDTRTLLASTTTTAGTQNGTGDAVYLPMLANAYIFLLSVDAAATDNADVLAVTVATKIGSNWCDCLRFQDVAGDDSTPLKQVGKITAGTAEAVYTDAALAASGVKHIPGDQYRIEWSQTDADNDASFQFMVEAIPC